MVQQKPRADLVEHAVSSSTQREDKPDPRPLSEKSAREKALEQCIRSCTTTTSMLKSIADVELQGVTSKTIFDAPISCQATLSGEMRLQCMDRQGLDRELERSSAAGTVEAPDQGKGTEGHVKRH